MPVAAIIWRFSAVSAKIALLWFVYHLTGSPLEMTIIGASTALFTPLLWTMLQRYADASVRGRVFTLVGTTDMAASTLAMALVGVLAEYLGPSFSLRALAAMFIAVALFIAILTVYRGASCQRGHAAVCRRPRHPKCRRSGQYDRSNRDRRAPRA